MKSSTLYALGLAAGLLFTGTINAQNANQAPFKAVKKFVMPAGVTEEEYIPKTIVFKVSPQYRGVAGLNGIQHPQLQLVLNYLGVSKLERKFPNHKAPAKEKNELGQKYADLSLIYQLTYINSVEIDQAINQLLFTGALTYAEPHYIYKMFDYEPNDSRADSVTGQQRNAFKRIRAYKAWDLALGGSRGDVNTTIGIVDSGSDMDHPDLLANFKQNAADPIDGADNDGDGYIDNFNGWDLGGADYNNVVGDNNPTIMGANNNHGSHVSGCASQVSDNGTGGAGIGFNCKLLIVKAAADNDTRGAGGVGYIIGGYEGITYAADHGAHVINCSWGGAGGGSFGQDIVDYATINMNALVIAAAGNDGTNTAYFPASYNYVLSVAATNSTSDARATFSNYDYSVDISAPGNGIDASMYNNNYASSSGTSMSSPIVAGAAGLVKSKFPTYTAMQIGQRLKQTTDYNYAAGPNITTPAITQAGLQNKMGKGRLNAFRALTDPQAPSVVFINSVVDDHNDHAIVVGDTIFISGDFINYLAATSSGTVASIRAISGTTYVTPIDTTAPLGAIATLGTVNNTADQFTFKINPGTPLNSVITLRVLIKDGAYYDQYFINVTVNVDYINISINDLQTTITSKGRIGWNQAGPPPSEGLGFTYLGTQMMYEGGLMIGTGTATVSDCVRGEDGTTADADFNSISSVSRAIPNVVSEFDCHGILSDAPATPTQNIRVSHSAYAWSVPGHRKYVIVQYYIKNTGASALSNLYAGIASDWDIPGPSNGAQDYAKNKADYDASRKMGYAWFSGTNGKYAGIKVLTPEAGNHYGIDNLAGGNGGIDINDAGNFYSTADKYTALSTPRLQAGMADVDGEDVLNVVSSGPFSINAGDSIKVAFALICGDDLTDLQESADSAQVQYDGAFPIGLIKQNKSSEGVVLYPNPAANNMNVVIPDAQGGMVTISLVNMVGQTVKSYTFQNTPAGYNKFDVDLTDVAEGAYTCKIFQDKGKQTIGKIIVTKSHTK
ncbi:MAG: in-like serine protease [Bacteroidetes bacterium]|jgi:subtilisin family serine protease|nr:in-like serine protease [Bacteroidota bacterium]